MKFFRREVGLLFIDESGQLQPPRDERPHEVGVVAGLLMPDTQRDRDELASLVSEIRQRVCGSCDCHEVIKARMLDEATYDLIARTIRERWFVGCPALEITQHDVDTMRATFKLLVDAIEQSKKKLGAGKSLDARLGFLQRQYSTAVAQHPIYMSLLFTLYRDIARWFRKNNILPRLRVVLDDKLHRADKELLDFFGRFAIWTEFPEVYSNRLGALLGLDPTADFVCSVSSDTAQDGLVIADAIAFAVGAVRRGADAEGKYQRVLDVMNVDCPLPESGMSAPPPRSHS